jgi:hypothetical protein
MQTRPNKLIQLVIALLVGLTLSLSSRAEDKKVDPTGTWIWTFTQPNGDTFEPKLTLKLEGDKLTGRIKGRDAEEADIESAKLSGDEISFQVLRDGNKIAIRFQGKITGDTIKGTTEIDRNGEVNKREWLAKRQAAAKATVNVTGPWKYSFTNQNGETVEFKVRLKQDGEKLTGTVAINDSDRPISEGKVEGSDVTFKIVHERNGGTQSSSYKGKVAGDTMKGKVTFNRDGEERSVEIDATRAKD